METLHRHGLLNPKTALSRLILFPGSRLYRETGAQGPARPAELPPRAASLYRELERRLGPALRLWTRAAALLPGAAAATISAAPERRKNCARCWAPSTNNAIGPCFIGANRT